MNIVIRVDASIEMGTGHVMRCLTLADEFKKQSITSRFICRNINGHMGKLIRSKGYEVVLLPSPESKDIKTSNNAKWLRVSVEQDANETSDALGDQIDLLIIDHYGIDYRWHEILRPRVKKIFVIDDLADRQLDCDFLLNQNIGYDTSSYKGLVPSQCQLLIGVHFILLRPQFSQYRVKTIGARLKVNEVKRILIFMGGYDPRGLVSQIVKALSQVQMRNQINFDLIVNETLPTLELLLEQIKADGLPITLLTNVDNMAEVMSIADIAIGAGGSASWERCCLGLPTLLISIADNQQNNVRHLVAKKAAIDLGDRDCLSTKVLIDALDGIISKPELVNNMTKHALNICDGLGVYRVVQKLLLHVMVNTMQVILRPVEAQDAQRMFI